MCKKLICMFMETATMRKGIFLLMVGVMIVFCLPGSYVKAADRGGLVGYWPFDGDTMDKSGSGYHATAVNGPTFVPGIAGQAILLDADADAQGQYLTVDTPTMVPVPWTVCVWVKRHKDAVNYAASGLLDGGNGGDQWCGIRLEGYQANHRVGFCEYINNHNWAWDYLTPIDEWTHLAIIGTDSGVTLYADSIFIGTIEEAASWPVWIDRIGKTYQYNCPVDADLDDLGIWDLALTEEEVLTVYTHGPLALDAKMAGKPNPDDAATDVPRDVVLNWKPGEFANTHNVYLGTVFDDVNDAVLADAASAGQTANTYDPPGHLDFSQTYFWRIDEVNAPPDSTILKGFVWSFTTEPIGYPIAGANITATASSSMAGSSPQKTVDGSGLNDSDLHSINMADAWLSDLSGTQPTWIEYQFDKAYKLHEMWVWNQNQVIEPSIGYGFKDVTIEYSVDGIDYATLGTTHEFARAPAPAGDYAHNTTVDLGGAMAKYVRLTANSNWGGILAQYGLSEVRFFSIPVLAREPYPASGATDVDVDLTLAWRAGREADKHDVYLSTDEQAVIDGTAPVETVTGTSYSASLDVDSTYYWRVDEVNDAETTTMWQGDIWNFSTPEFLVVDDFESYNDIPFGEEGSNLVYETWIDGFANPSVNGSTVGYTVPFEPTMETVIVHGGEQSMPFLYSNTGGATYSEAGRTFAVPQDWTKAGIQTLVLYLLADSLPGALDTTFGLTTDGGADWFSQAAISYHDGDAAQSGAISHNEESLMQTTVSGAGTVRFYWKVSSEADWDFLEFYIDGSLQDQISGTVDWQQMTYAITGSGSHTLEWRYMKDGAVSGGEDTGWVDKLEWTGGGQPAEMPGNTGQLYVKVNGVKLAYPGNVADIPGMQWNIDLASLGVNLQAVTRLAIGIDGNGASGTLYFDDFRLER